MAIWRSGHPMVRSMWLIVPSPSKSPAAQATAASLATPPSVAANRFCAQMALSDEPGLEVAGGRVRAQHEREQRPAVLRVELDAAAHHLGQLPRDGEAEAAAGRAGPVEAVEALEDLLL